MLKVIKKLTSLVRMSFCKHEMVLKETEYRNINGRVTRWRLWYKCPKCGKMIHEDITGRENYGRNWHDEYRKRA